MHSTSVYRLVSQNYVSAKFLEQKYKPELAAQYGGVESTVIERRQHQLGRMVDFPHPVTFSVFDL